MRRHIIAGNWKMHGSRAENAALVEAIVHKLPNNGAEVWVCPPFVYLAELSRALAGSSISLGAQDVCAETQGAFTGEVSATMLKDVGCAGCHRRTFRAARPLRRIRSARGAQVCRRAGRGADAHPLRRRVAGRARSGAHLRSGGSPARRRPRSVGCRCVHARRHRVRACLGDWHGKDRVAATGRRSACPHPRADRGSRC